MTPTPNNEALAAKISEYGSLMFSAGMDAASDFRDRHRDSKEKCAEADELLDEIVAALSSGQAASAVPEGWRIEREGGVLYVHGPDKSYAIPDVLADHAIGGPERLLHKLASALLAASPTQPASAPAREGADQELPGMWERADFTGGETDCSTPPAPRAPSIEPVGEAKLWLWKNGDHFWAFDNLYPCSTPGGDPMTLGEPVGYAIFKPSHCRAGKESA